MSKYKIGITEQGDASIDLSWIEKLNSVDGAVIITKNISSQLAEAVLEYNYKIILHATITGYGGTILEPNVPQYKKALANVHSLLCSGFLMDHVVIRVDPIIPTEKGIKTAYRVFHDAIDMGFFRYRVSLIDMYPHVRERFYKAGLPLPYGPSGFFPIEDQVKAVDNMLEEVRLYADGKNMELSIESCAEPGLTSTAPCGCISHRDLYLLGLDPQEDDHLGLQRSNCMCYSGKTELLKNKRKCPHGCLYCYWK